MGLYKYAILYKVFFDSPREIELVFDGGDLRTCREMRARPTSHAGCLFIA